PTRATPPAVWREMADVIVDGDTLDVLEFSTNRLHKIRLQGIDSPEGHQAFGEQAKLALREKVYRKKVRVEWLEKGQDKLKALKPNFKAFYTNDANSQQLLASGETPVQVVLSMNAYYMISQGVPITLAIPKEGAVLVAEHPNDLVRDQYVMKLSGRLEIEPDRVREAVANVRSRPHVRSASESAPRPVEQAPVERRELDALRW
ncbi:hypothetical protein B4Q13_20880, partial [Lacticaseibacillus rhamnosus]